MLKHSKLQLQERLSLKGYSCSISCPMLERLHPRVRVQHICMDDVTVKGAGLQRFVLGENNVFFIDGKCLTAGSVNVLLSDANVVAIADDRPGRVIITYRPRVGLKTPLTILVLIAQLPHSQYTAIPGMSSPEAAYQLKHYSLSSNEWRKVFMQYCDHRNFLLTLFDRLQGEVVVLMEAACRYHLKDEEVQWKNFYNMTKYFWYGHEAFDTKDAHALAMNACTAMDSNKSSIKVQTWGCYAMGGLVCALTQQAKRISFFDRAVVVCRRAHDAGIVSADYALNMLQGKKSDIV